MSEEIFNIAKTCCVSGHRNVLKDLNIEKLKQTFFDLINDGYDTFMVGMALGFDTICFNILEEIRENNKIKIVACIPCVSQAYKFSQSENIEYNRMIKSADQCVYTGVNYNKWCMQKRNRYMVDNSSCLLVYLRRDFGGTFYTYKYAKEKDIKIVEL